MAARHRRRGVAGGLRRGARDRQGRARGLDDRRDARRRQRSSRRAATTLSGATSSPSSTSIAGTRARSARVSADDVRRAARPGRGAVRGRVRGVPRPARTSRAVACRRSRCGARGVSIRIPPTALLHRARGRAGCSATATSRSTAKHAKHGFTALAARRPRPRHRGRDQARADRVGEDSTASARSAPRTSSGSRRCSR